MSVPQVGVGQPTSLAIARGHFERSQFVEAERICREYLRFHPNDSQMLHLLGEVNARVGAFAFAIAFLRKAIANDRTRPEYHQTLGSVLLRQQRWADAEASARQALTLEPNHVKALNTLAQALRYQDRRAEAEVCIRNALSLDPSYIEAYRTLAGVLNEQGRVDEAEAIVREALSVDLSEAYRTLAGVLNEQGRVDEAEAIVREALSVDPSAHEVRSGLLFILNYQPGYSRDAAFAEAREWGQRHAEPLRETIRPHTNHPDPERRLRIGYVSGDFNHHPVGHLLEPVLAAHDRSRVELYCYTTAHRSDDLTARLRSGGDCWRTIVNLDDEAATDRIRRDEIDILVDLSGHTGGSRLLVFARKPAPIQATWLGYFATTGITAVDYIIADRVLIPEGDERYYVEQVVRLPDAWWSFKPPRYSDRSRGEWVASDAAVGPLPALSSGQITFGCFNKIAKVNSRVVAVWADILRGVPDARMLLKFSGFDDPSVRSRYAAMFAEHGVAADQVVFEGRSSYPKYLEAFNRVDIALDPFPYNGGATSIDGLWMGVPLITLRGDRFVSRFGCTLLSSLGMDDFIADSPADYVRKAVALASDPATLAELRARLRPLMARSNLCDPQRFARGLEDAYRQMWQAWCLRQQSGSAFAPPRHSPTVVDFPCGSGPRVLDEGERPASATVRRRDFGDGGSELAN